jgi:UPF0271 protein
MKVVLDASALLSGRLSSLSGLEAYVTPEVVAEVSKGRPRQLLEGLLSAGLTVMSPSSTGRARELAEVTGDLPHLSEADLSVIALALELDASAVTDDFRVQNVLGAAGASFQNAGEIGGRTIGRVWRWSFRCRGCGRRFDEELPDCPVCGSPLKKVRSGG